IWRIGGVAWRRPEGAFPRACAREPCGFARQKTERPMNTRTSVAWRSTRLTLSVIPQTAFRSRYQLHEQSTSEKLIQSVTYALPEIGTPTALSTSGVSR